MQYRRVGASGLRVSEIALGSWLTLGTRVDAASTEKLVRHALDLGVNLFDCADVYQSGRGEEALGRALKGVPRPQVVIATKAYFAMSDAPNDAGLSRKHLVESVEGSLRRLGVEYLDLHQCHRYDPEVPLEETVSAYDALIRAGKLLYWGVSHWSADQVADAQRVARALGTPPPISNQPEYSLLRREIERDLLPACARLGVGQLVYSPLAQGVLTGKYAGGARPGESRADDAKRNRWMGDLIADRAVAQVERLRPIAAELGISLAQLALAWCLRRPEVSAVIIGATRPEQLDENCAASGVALPPRLLRRIERIF